MTVTAALVLFAVIWFLTLFVVLPIGLVTQGEAGQVVRGTPSSAPAELRLKRKFVLVTAITLALWVPLCAVIVWGGISVRDLDVWDRM
jgi:predicted secreted protein